MKQALSLIALLAATPVLAQETRQLDAHQHGVGALDIAIDGAIVAIGLRAPGADIVGFEYAPETAADRAAVDGAVATLARPLDLFVLPAAAGCSVTRASARLEGNLHEAEQDGHEAHDDHDDHEEAGDHAGHDDHAAHDDHDDHADGDGHTEFHAEYTLACAEPEALTEITFAYFSTFENARELEVMVITNTGAQAFEVVRDAPALDLRHLF